ncbi:MAG TPA: DnaD domain protein [Dehalococcoidia bacterium]|nr:DnaD domain protein [Dehalococcoidia bacterium]
MKPFPGFPTRLPQTEDPEELNVLLYFFWLLGRKGRPYLSLGELQADGNLNALGEEGIARALERAAERAVLLPLNRDGRRLYFLNSPQGQEARAGMEKGAFLAEEKTNIFDLYEQNIGLITPIIADQLQEAEALYPTPWIEEAVKLAVRLNRRRWSTISRILERWAVEGKDGEPGRDSEKGADPHQFTRGKYGHLYRY